VYGFSRTWPVVWRPPETCRRRGRPRKLGAGFNRSTLLSNPAQPTTSAADFYRTDLTNHYSKAIHAATEDGKAYGFAFDDVADFASFIQDTAPTAIRLTLTPF
jgi:hypothetical protein